MKVSTMGFRRFFYCMTDPDDHSIEHLIKVSLSGSCTLEKIYQKKDSRTYKMPVIPISLVDYDSNCASFSDMILTQTLFNSDELLEYIEPIYDIETNKWESSEFRENIYYFGDYFGLMKWFDDESKPSPAKGFAICDENHRKLQSIRFDNGLVAAYEQFMSILIIGGKKYLSCYLKDSDDKNYTVLYEITGKTSGVQKVATYKTRVYPTLVSQGENVTVSVPDIHSDETVVEVNNISGRNVFRERMTEGDNKMTIPADAMPRGINIITISDGDNYTKDSHKVMVK